MIFQERVFLKMVLKKIEALKKYTITGFFLTKQNVSAIGCHILQAKTKYIACIVFYLGQICTKI